MGRTGARDSVEAMLLDVHHARYLERHPGVRVRDSILQDQLLAEGAGRLSRRVRRELDAWRKAREHYLARRPVFSPADAPRPWH